MRPESYRCVAMAIEIAIFVDANFIVAHNSS
jgi:hypothetical protein